MQTDNKELYRLTADRTGKPEQLYKDIGNAVFTELARTFRSPKTLITKLKGVGTWYLRRSRMKIKLQYYPIDFDRTEADFDTKDGFLKHENKVTIYRLFQQRLADYEEYVRIRDETRKKRHETQRLIQPVNRQDTNNKES